MTMSDEEVRYLAVSLLQAPTARDMQGTIGASNLANGCDFCLASELSGASRETPQTERTWLGRVLGTSLHATFEARMRAALEEAEEARLAQQVARSALGRLAKAHPNALVEEHRILGVIPEYGEVGTTGDLILVDEEHGIDWKGSTRKKTCLLRDFLAISAGRPAPFGRTHKDVKLSEKQYQDEMAAMAYKVNGYYAQTQLYAKVYGCRRFSLVFVNRDGTGYFDTPSASDYDNDARVRDVFVLSFDVDLAYADAVWQRGLDIWARLQAGASLADFPSHEHCFACSFDEKDMARFPDAPIIVPVAA
jgi:hypothetical protein